MEILKLLLPYLDSISFILVLGISAVWALYKGKDKQLLGRMEAQITNMQKELDEIRDDMEKCIAERARQQVKVEYLERDNRQLREENKRLWDELANLKSRVIEHSHT